MDVQRQSLGADLLKGVLKNFAEFTGKDLCQGLYFNEAAGLRPFLIEHLSWLLLDVRHLKNNQLDMP